MPIKPYYSQKEPAADAVIWRFMDLRKFRDLMASEELYFRRADLFDDDTEGLPTEQYVQRVLRLNPLDINDRRELNNHLGSLAQSREMHYITCWYLYDQETLKMWEGYGHDGVAIVSRYDFVKAALDKLIDEAHIGLIQYGAAHLTNRFNALEFITTKQAKYEHECEVRAMLTCTNPLSGGNRHIDLNDIPHPRPLPMNPRHAWVPDCKRRRIVLKDLVQEVVISPWAEADNVEEIKLWNSLKGFNAPRDSALRDCKTPTLEEYRNHMGIMKPLQEPERVATEHELQDFYEELSTLTEARVRWLYRQRWDKCYLEPGNLPSTFDAQHLGTTLKVLKGMKNDTRRAQKRPEHHVVHDYASLVSSWRLREPHHVTELMRIPTANGHAWHAFQMNCRKMFEFFKYKPDAKRTYLRAAYFIDGELGYKFVHWTDSVQEFMNAHLLHVGMGRVDNEIINDGRHDKKYFEDFESAWQTLMRSLKAEHRDIFREEIDFRLQDREFAFCGTLGREFIPL